MAMQMLRSGNLVLPTASESDSGVYSCIVSVVAFGGGGGLSGGGDGDSLSGGASVTRVIAGQQRRIKKKKILQTVVRIQKEIVPGKERSVQVVSVDDGQDLKLECQVLPGTYEASKLLYSRNHRFSESHCSPCRH